MAFQIDTHTLPNIRDYASARRHWEKTKPWRGTRDTDARPIGSRTRKGQTIREGNNHQIICTLYNTDVVIYYENGDIELTAWSSVSTDNFANNLLPSGISTCFNHDLPCVRVGPGYRWDEGGRFYRISNNLLLRKNEEGEWRPVDHKDTFTRVLLDKKKVRDALKRHRYADFAAYMKMLVAMNQSGEAQTLYKRASERVALLDAGPSEWRYMSVAQRQRWETTDPLERTLSEMRLAIYEVEDCIVKDKVEYVNSWSEVQAIRKNANLYHFARWR